jgi:hypothetical protein
MFQDICDFISARMKISDNLETVCNEVIDACLHKVGLYTSFSTYLE